MSYLFNHALLGPLEDKHKDIPSNITKLLSCINK